MNRIVIDEHPVPGKRLGRNVEHDPRSRNFPFLAAAKPKLRTVHHRRYGSAFDQGSLGSCSGNAVAGAINTLPLHHTGAAVLAEADAVAIYALATTLDGFDGTYPPDDPGSSGLAAAQAAKNKGLISGYRHAFSIDEALAALMVGPVITGVSWYETFDSPGDHGLVTIGGQVRGGHEFEVLGYEAHTKEVVCENSWGAGWGVGGRFRMSVATWAQLLDDQGDATILDR